MDLEEEEMGPEEVEMDPEEVGMDSEEEEMDSEEEEMVLPEPEAVGMEVVGMALPEAVEMVVVEALPEAAGMEAAARVSRSPERPRTGDETPELRGDEHAFGERVRSGDAGEEVLALRVVGVASWASRPCLCPFAGEPSDDKAKLVSLSRRANSAGAGKSRSVSSVNGDRV